MNTSQTDWVEDTPLEISSLPADKVECFALISWLIKECNRAREALRELRKSAVWTPSTLERINLQGHILYLKMCLREARDDADNLVRGIKLVEGANNPQGIYNWGEILDRIKNHDSQVSRRRPEDLDPQDRVLVWRHSLTDLATDIAFSLKKEDVLELIDALKEKV